MVETPSWDLDASLSPDGRWLSYSTEAKDGFHVYVRPYNRDGKPVRVSLKSGRGPVWSKQGDKLWYSGWGDEGLYEIKMSEGQPVSKPVKKFSGAEGMFNDIWTQSYDISPSGKWYNFLPGPKTPQARIEVVTNWFSELNRAIPLRR